MLEALKTSTEDPALKKLARSYVYGIKGDLARRRKARESQRLLASQQNDVNSRAIPTHFPTTGHSSSPDEIQGPPTIDLTAEDGSVPRRPPVNPLSSSLNGLNSSRYRFEH